MRISFENFGKVPRGSIRINNLTIICGPNGSGKTYTSYAIYGCLNHFSELLDFGIDSRSIQKIADGEPVSISLKEIRESLPVVIEKAGTRFRDGLDAFFNAPEGFFSQSTFQFEIDRAEFQVPAPYSKTISVSKDGRIDLEVNEHGDSLLVVYSETGKERIPRQLIRRILSDEIAYCFFSHTIPSPFVVTSERTGVALFYKELDINRNAILSHISSTDKIDPINIIRAMQSRYARPIQHNIEIVREYSNVSKRKSYLKENYEEFSPVFETLSDLVGGIFRDNDNQLFFSPRKERKRPKVTVPLYISSSSTKSLFLIDMYINHLAEPDGMLIIDEPELNLHPDNQVLMARLVARLVNAGVKVLVTTHSDYFIREINNLITLGQFGESERNPMMARYGYLPSDLLLSQQVSAYRSTKSSGVVEIGMTPSGLDTEIFDEIISHENIKSQDIYLSSED